MKILYICYAYSGMGVYKSQVHTLCNSHNEKNNVVVLSLCNGKEMKKRELENTDYRLVRRRKVPKEFIPILCTLQSFLFRDTSLFKWADVIHCRGQTSTAFAKKVMDRIGIFRQVIADIRGELVAELRHKGGVLSGLFSFWAAKLEEVVFRKVEIFFFVSENMKKHYISKYKIENKSSYIFPTIVDDRYFFISRKIRNEKRKELGLDDKFTYVYSGGVDYWQNLDKIIDTFSIKCGNNPRFFFLLIVTDPSKILKIVENYKLTNIRVFKVPYEQVGSYLNAADAGVLIREPCLVNYVASPTKIGEYLACGLKIADSFDHIGSEGFKYLNSYSYKPLKEIIQEQNKIYKMLGNEKVTTG